MADRHHDTALLQGTLTIRAMPRA